MERMQVCLFMHVGMYALGCTKKTTLFRIKVEMSEKLCISMIKKMAFLVLLNIDVLRPDRALPWEK